jgi:hypothetical protein
MKAKRKKYTGFIDTYELGLDDLEWGLGYPIAEYSEDKKLMRFSIEQNILDMIQKVNPSSEIVCIENQWNKDRTKLFIVFEIKEEI